MTVSFCTLAIQAAYRRRARLLCGDAPELPWFVLTDEPDDFSDLNVRAIKHVPTGPMASEYLALLPPTGEGRGAAAYHDKRFALIAGLKEFETAVYVDADSRIVDAIRLTTLPDRLAALPVVRKSVFEHLQSCGKWRLPFFEELAKHLTGDACILKTAEWCHESLIAVTRDGRESQFFSTWSRAADFLQSRQVFSGEGGVIGLSAAMSGWTIDFEVLSDLAAVIQHEGGGPKSDRPT